MQPNTETTQPTATDAPAKRRGRPPGVLLIKRLVRMSDTEWQYAMQVGGSSFVRRLIDEHRRANP
jgi:hypothetical protein